MPDLAVIIVTWNVRDLVLNALRSLYDDLRSSEIHYHVIVVDNASCDGTPEAISAKFPQVELIVSNENLGFGRANNLAMKRLGFDGSATGDELPRVVYLLNPDTVTKLGATRQLYDALMSDPRVGLVGAKLCYMDGRFQHSAFGFPGLRQIWAELFPTPGRWIEGPFNGRYARRLYETNQAFPVDFTLGATMMIKRDVILRTGMFDETLFMYCEEIDWALRIRKSGWAIQCVPSAEVVHLSGQSAVQVRAESFINLWKSRLRIYEKHYPGWKVKIARRMIAIGMRRKLQATGRSLDGAESVNEMRRAYQTVYEMARGT